MSCQPRWPHSSFCLTPSTMSCHARDQLRLEGGGGGACSCSAALVTDTAVERTGGHCACRRGRCSCVPLPCGRGNRYVPKGAFVSLCRPGNFCAHGRRRPCAKRHALAHRRLSRTS